MADATCDTRIVHRTQSLRGGSSELARTLSHYDVLRISLPPFQPMHVPSCTRGARAALLRISDFTCGLMWVARSLGVGISSSNVGP